MAAILLFVEGAGSAPRTRLGLLRNHMPHGRHRNRTLPHLAGAFDHKVQRYERELRKGRNARLTSLSSTTVDMKVLDKFGEASIGQACRKEYLDK